MPSDPPASSVTTLVATTPSARGARPPRQKIPKILWWFIPVLLVALLGWICLPEERGFIVGILGIVIATMALGQQMIDAKRSANQLRQVLMGAEKTISQLGQILIGAEKTISQLGQVLAKIEKLDERQEQIAKAVGVEYSNLLPSQEHDQTLSPGTIKQSRSQQEIREEVFKELDKKYNVPEGTFAKEIRIYAQKIKDNPAASRWEKANAAYALGNFAEAENLFLENAAEQERERRTENIVESYKNAGWSAQKARRYGPAIDHFRKATQHTDQRQDPIRWAEIQHALAFALDDAGKHRDAEVILRKVIKQRTKDLGPEAPDTLTSRNNLAIALHAQGKYAEAETEYRSVQRLREKVLGAKHPDTLGSRNNLAIVLHDHGKYAEAETEYRAVLALRKEVLGVRHPHTLNTCNNLATVLHDQDKYADAEAAHQAVLELREIVLGAEHPNTLNSRNHLARARNAQGRHVEAETEHRTVLKLQEDILGNKHPDALISRRNLAVALNCQRRHTEAEAECRKALRLLELEEIRGGRHPSTLSTRHSLAIILCDQGKHVEAKAECQLVLKLRKEVLGKIHPKTHETRELLRRIKEKRNKEGVVFR